MKLVPGRVDVDGLRTSIREVPDFPRPGINFYDVTTLFRGAATFRSALDLLEERFRGHAIDALAGIEARGFVLAAALADRLGTGLVLARKPGKLPSAVERESYALEYGEATIEIHRDAVAAGQRILIVDDVLATGGTARAVANVIERLGGNVAGYAFLVELEFLTGRSKLGAAEVFSLLHYGS